MTCSMLHSVQTSQSPLLENTSMQYYSCACTAAPLSDLRMGTSMMGPLPLTTSNSMPRAGRGVKMSLNMMTPSGWKACQGCRDRVRAISVVSDLSLKLYLSEYLRCKGCMTSTYGTMLSSWNLRHATRISLSEGLHVPSSLPHEPYGSTLSLCVVFRYSIQAAKSCLTSAVLRRFVPSPLATLNSSGS